MSDIDRGDDNRSIGAGESVHSGLDLGRVPDNTQEDYYHFTHWLTHRANLLSTFSHSYAPAVGTASASAAVPVPPQGSTEETNASRFDGNTGNLNDAQIRAPAVFSPKSAFSVWQKR